MEADQSLEPALMRSSDSSSKVRPAGSWRHQSIIDVFNPLRSAEFLEWEAKRLADIETASLSKAAIQPIGYEGGFGGQEGLRDKYATTSGEH